MKHESLHGDVPVNEDDIYFLFRPVVMSTDCIGLHTAA